MIGAEEVELKSTAYKSVHLANRSNVTVNISKGLKKINSEKGQLLNL